MKVNLNPLHKANFTDTSFTGFKPVKNSYGFNNYEFSCMFDDNRDDCYLEVFHIGKDDNNNYYVTNKAHANTVDGKYRINPHSNMIDMSEVFGIDDGVPFAYHFVLKSKHSDYKRVIVDSGDIINFKDIDNDADSIYNLVLPQNSSRMSNGGSMKLVIIDSQNVGYLYDGKNKIYKDKDLARRGESGIRTVANKFGGTLAGLEKGLDDGQYDAYSKIIAPPIFTDDSFSALGYWNKNCFQITESLGNINNYASFQRKLFAHGINFVSDASYVNEGLMGVHFKHMAKWGSQSPFFMWFKAPGLNDGPLSYGVFVKNKKFITHKVVNSPYTYTQKKNGQISVSTNHDYDKTKPTYIQFLDSRLATDKEKHDTKNIVELYSKTSTDNPYELHTHNDSVFPYYFEINPEFYNENIKRLNEYNSMFPKEKRITYDSPLAARILSKSEYFEVGDKHEGGFETWDANTDIAKLNFTYSFAESKRLKNLTDDQSEEEVEKIIRANCQTQDYVVTSGKYWTQKTDDILRLSIARNLKNISDENPSLVYKNILNICDNKTFPKSLKYLLTKDEVENVLDGMYKNKRVLSDEDKKSQILENLMNTPLDSIEFGDNLVSVFSSPLITKRAVVQDDIGVGAYDLFKSGNQNLLPEYRETYLKMQDLYQNQILDYAVKILDQVENKSNGAIKFFDGNKVSEYGKYVLPLVVPEILKFMFVKSLARNVKVFTDENSDIVYDYKALKQVHTQSLGITNPSNPVEEAKMVLSKLEKGFNHIKSADDDFLVNSLINSLKGTSAESFKLADLIIDKTQAGLDWRIDATKDIADIEAIRNRNSSFDFCWNQVIDFWKLFVKNVYEKNPNSFITAEVTDADDLYKDGSGSSSYKYSNRNDIKAKFFRDTGINSAACYSRFFHDIPQLFGQKTEDGATFDDAGYRQRMIYELMSGQNNYLKDSSLNSIIYSYNSIGNHDKPRILHCLAMDMSLFYSDLNDVNNYKQREMAYKLLNDKFFEDIKPDDVNSYDFSAVSSKAIAMGYALRTSFIKVLEKYKNSGMLSEKDFNSAFISVSKAICDMCKGKFMNSRFDADAFGIKPFDVSISMVLKHAKEKYNLNLPPNVDSIYEKDVFERALTPAITKLLGCMKYLTALPGIPTMYDGDDTGSTGYDSKTKNLYLQGRQKIHEEWGEKYKDFIGKHKAEFDKIMAVRKKPECEALNNGNVYMLPLQHSSDNRYAVPAVLRQSTNGKMAISIFNTSNLGYNPDNNYTPENVVLDCLTFNFEDFKDGSNRIEMREGFDVSPGIQGLKNNTVFVNANDENDLYYVNECDGKYVLKRACDNGKITLNDSTLILYHVPEKKNIPFTGKYNISPSASMIKNLYGNYSDNSSMKKIPIALA